MAVPVRLHGRREPAGLAAAHRHPHDGHPVLPAGPDQQITDVAAQGWYRTSLSESIIGYGALEEDDSAPVITNGETTGTVTADDAGSVYQRTITTRGGVVVQDLSG
jgi:hypothetical protein